MRNDAFFSRNSLKYLPLASLLLLQNQVYAVGEFEHGPEKRQGTQQFDWLNFNPQQFKPPQSLVPGFTVSPAKAARYKNGAGFTHDPTRSSVVYGRGRDKLPTEIYAKAFQILMIKNKLYQVPAAGESKKILIDGDSIILYGTSYYTPVPQNSFVANPAQVSPFTPDNIFYNENSVWPSIIYGAPGEELCIAGHKFKFPAHGESISVVFGADGRLKQDNPLAKSPYTKNSSDDLTGNTQSLPTNTPPSQHASRIESINKTHVDEGSKARIETPGRIDERTKSSEASAGAGERPSENLKNQIGETVQEPSCIDTGNSTVKCPAATVQESVTENLRSPDSANSVSTPELANTKAATSRYISKLQTLSNGAGNEFITDSKTGKQYAVIIRDAAGNILGCTIYDTSGQITPAYPKPDGAATYAGDSYIGIWYKNSGEPIPPADKNLIQGPRGYYDPRFKGICLETGLPTDSAGNYLNASNPPGSIATAQAAQASSGILPPSFGTQSNPLVWSNSVDGKYYNTQGIIKGTYALNELSRFGYSMLDGGGKLVSIESVASNPGSPSKAEAPKQMTFIGLDGKVTSVGSGQGLYLDAKGNPTVYNKGDSLLMAADGAVKAVSPNQSVFIDTKGNSTLYNKDQTLIVGVNGAAAAVTKGQPINIGPGGYVLNNELATKSSNSSSRYNFFDAAAGAQGRQLADKWLNMPQDQFNQALDKMRNDSKTGSGYIADSSGLGKLTDAQLQTLYRTTTPEGQLRLKQIVQLEGNQFGMNSNNEGSARANKLFSNDWSTAVDPNIVPVQKMENGLMSWGTNTMKVTQQNYNGAGQKWVDPQGQTWEFGQNGALAQTGSGLVKGSVAEVTAGQVRGSGASTEYWANPYNFGTDRPYFGDNPNQGTQKVGLSVNREKSLGFGSNEKTVGNQVNLNQVFDNNGQWVDPSRLSNVADNPLLMKDRQTGATLDLETGEWKESTLQIANSSSPPPKGFTQAYSPWTSPSKKYYLNPESISRAVRQLTDPYNSGNPSVENAYGKTATLDVWDQDTNTLVKSTVSFNSDYTKLMIDVNLPLRNGAGSRSVIMVPVPAQNP